MSKLRAQFAFSGGGARLVELLPHLAGLQNAWRAAEVDITRVGGSSAGAIAAALIAFEIDGRDVQDYLCEKAGLLAGESTLGGFFRQPVAKSRAILAARKVRRLEKKMRAMMRAGSSVNLRLGRASLLPEAYLRTGLREVLLRSRSLFAVDVEKPQGEGTAAVATSPLITPAAQLVVYFTDLRSQTLDSIVFRRSVPVDVEAVVSALVSSAAIPFVIRGPSSEGIYDGGIARNLPADELAAERREFGVVFAVNFGQPLAEGKRRGLAPDRPSLTQETDAPAALAIATMNTAIDAMTDKVLASADVISVPVPVHFVRHAVDVSGAVAYLNLPETAIEEKVVKAEENWRRILGVHEEYHHSKERLRLTEQMFGPSIAAAGPTSNLSRKSAAESTRALMVPTTYTSLENVANLQTALKSKLEHLGWADTYDKADAEVFDAVKRPGLAISNETIYLFPFLLTSVRRPFWGVIPYGAHRGVGVIARREWQLPVALERCAYSEDEPGGKVEPGLWIELLLSRMMEEEGHGSQSPSKPVLYSCDGYMHEELLALSAGFRQKEAVQAAYCFRARPYARTVEKGIVNLIPPNFDLFRDDDLGDILVFDLADKKKVEAAVQKKWPDRTTNWDSFAVRHGLHVPVGVGFSLRAYPLLSGDTWRDIASLASDQLWSARGELPSAGIEFSDELGYEK